MAYGMQRLIDKAVQASCCPVPARLVSAGVGPLQQQPPKRRDTGRGRPAGPSPRPVAGRDGPR